MAIAEKMPAASQLEEHGREEWVQAVDALMDQVTQWSRLQGWRTIAHEKQIVEETTHKEYATLVLDIITEPDYSGLCRDVKLVIEPIFFDAARTSSRVDFFVWPALYDVVLLYETSRHEWTMRGDARFHWPSSWSQDSFTAIAEGLLEMGR